MFLGHVFFNEDGGKIWEKNTLRILQLDTLYVLLESFTKNEIDICIIFVIDPPS